MPAQKEIRYHRHSKFRGQAVRLVESVPGMAGVWTCVTPALMVTTIQLGARSAVSTAPKNGVTYAAAPNLTGDAWKRALERSQALIQAGILAPALDAYRSLSGWTARFEKLCRIIFAIPTAVVCLVAWGSRSWFHMLGAISSATFR